MNGWQPYNRCGLASVSWDYTSSHDQRDPPTPQGKVFHTVFSASFSCPTLVHTAGTPTVTNPDSPGQCKEGTFTYLMTATPSIIIIKTKTC